MNGRISPVALQRPRKIATLGLVVKRWPDVKLCTIYMPLLVSAVHHPFVLEPFWIELFHTVALWDQFTSHLIIHLHKTGHVTVLHLVLRSAHVFTSCFCPVVDYSLIWDLCLVKQYAWWLLLRCPLLFWFILHRLRLSVVVRHVQLWLASFLWLVVELKPRLSWGSYSNSWPYFEQVFTLLLFVIFNCLHLQFLFSFFRISVEKVHQITVLPHFTRS